MAVVNGTVSVKIAIEGTGDGAKKVDEAKKSIKGLKEESTTASTQVASLGDRVDDLKGDAKSVNVVREGFENLRSNLGFVAGAIGTVITVATTLWNLLSHETPIPQFIIDTERAASAEYEFAKQLLQTVEASKAAALNIDAVRISTLKLSAANAAAAGDQKRAAELLQSAGIKEAASTVSATEKSIEDIFTRRRKLIEDAAAAEQRAKQLRSEGARAQFAGNQAGQGCDIALASRELNAFIQASAAAGLADFEANKARAEAASLTEQLGAQNEAIKAQKDALALAADTTINLDEMLIAPKATAGSAANKSSALRAALLRGDQKAIDAAFKASNDKGIPAANDNGDLVGALTGADALAKSAGQIDAYIQLFERQSLATDIRDFATALSEALPGMGEFAGALGEIAETWDAWGKGSKSTASAVTGSLGAIAKAGAAQIKDERLRAGVLSIIELGLGAATLFTNPAESAAHFAAAGILGSVAIFGGGGGGGSSRSSNGGGNRAPARIGGETLGQGAVQVVIHGNYYGGRAEQEAAQDFTRLQRRARGTGFEEGRSA